jgi:hypothetical protein
MLRAYGPGETIQNGTLNVPPIHLGKLNANRKEMKMKTIKPDRSMVLYLLCAMLVSTGAAASTGSGLFVVN